MRRHDLQKFHCPDSLVFSRPSSPGCKRGHSARGLEGSTGAREEPGAGWNRTAARQWGGPLSCSSCCVLSSESLGLGEDGRSVGGTWGWALEQPLGPEGVLGPGSTGTRVQIPAGLHDPAHVISPL